MEQSKDAHGIDSERKGERQRQRRSDRQGNKGNLSGSKARRIGYLDQNSVRLDCGVLSGEPLRRIKSA